MKKRNCIAVLIIICLLASTLIGCKDTPANQTQTSSSKEEASPKEAVAMGRYVEKGIVLPQLEEAERILDIVQAKDAFSLYTCIESSAYYTYRLQADGSWNKEESEWLTTALGKEMTGIQSIQNDESGNLYVWYFDESYLPHILKTTDEKTTKELNLPFAKNKATPCGYTIMGNGNIAISYLDAEISNYVFLYDGQTGEELNRFKIASLSTDNICNQMDALGTKLAIPNEAGEGFNVYDTESGSILDEIVIKSDSTLGTYNGIIKIGNNDDYYYLSTQGLQHFQSGGTIAETIIDGSLNTIGVEGIQYTALLPGDSADFQILFCDANHYEFAYYTYDSTMPTLPETQLSIYGLSKNKSISRTIASYQKEHPTIQITYYTAQSTEGATTVADSIRTLNTELLSKKGADILMLDGLPIESYIEKGVLADLSDVLSPLYSSGELLENFTAGYEGNEGKIYAVPARFSMPILLGDQEINQAFQSLDSLRQYVKSNPESDFIVSNLRTTTYDELAELVFLTNYQELIGDGKQINQETIIKFLETVKETGTVMGATVKAVPIAPTTETELQQIAQFNLENSVTISALHNQFYYPIETGMLKAYEISGIEDMMEPVSIKSQFGKEIATVNHSFIPTGIIGVNSSSVQLERAKDFVRCLLSEEEQLKDLGSGMPVNANALELYCNKKMEYSISTSSMFKGKEMMFSFLAPTKSEISDMITLAKTLTNSLNVDTVFKEMLLNEAKPFFEGTVNAQTAANAILSKANTYLTE